MDLNELRELIQILEDSALSELEIEEEGRRVRLQKPGPAAVAMQMGSYAPAPAAAAPAPAAAPSSELAPSGGGDAPKTDKEQLAAQGFKTIDSPMVGTYYSAPAPGEPPFVKVGDRVKDGQTVCIVEAMKLMNEVGAKFPCTIEKILVENGQPVEFGQPLFAVKPV